jgi:hypothetical protein
MEPQPGPVLFVHAPPFMPSIVPNRARGVPPPAKGALQAAVFFRYEHSAIDMRLMPSFQ